MTQTLFLAACRAILVGAISYALGKGWLTPTDASALTAVLVPLGALFGPALWVIYSNLNSKLVPHDSVAIQKFDGSKPDLTIGDHLPSDGVPAAKVVGALLLGLSLFAPNLGHAEGLKNPLSGLRQFAVNDIQAALDDATANGDDAARACWAALLPAVQNAQSPLPTKLGAFLALQKARDAIRNVDMFKAGVGSLADLKNKCAPIIIDVNTFMLKLGVLGGGAIIGF